MIGQKGTGSRNGIPPVRYEAVDECLKNVAQIALKYKASIHLPFLMCCDLAGGDWSKIEALLIKHLCEKDIYVTAYDFHGVRVN